MWDANAPVSGLRCAALRASAMRLAVAGDEFTSTVDVRQVPSPTGRTQTHAYSYSTYGSKQINPLSD